MEDDFGDSGGESCSDLTDGSFEDVEEEGAEDEFVGARGGFAVGWCVCVDKTECAVVHECEEEEDEEVVGVPECLEALSPHAF